MYEAEDQFWWYLGLRRVLASMLHSRAALEEAQGGFLDAGCGTGGNLFHLFRLVKPLTIGLDRSVEALGYAKQRGLERLLCADVGALPFRAESLGAIASVDVLFHAAVTDDTGALREAYRVLKRGGVLYLNLPAFQFLYSEHDRAVHTRHRYTRGKLVMQLRQVGFRVEKATYWNTFLFPVALVVRMMKKFGGSSGQADSDVKRPYPVLLNRILAGILGFEARMLRWMNFPIGLSVLVVARKELNT